VEEEFIMLDCLQLEPGMELGKDIFNSQGYLILREGTVLESNTINRLVAMDIKDIAILQDKKGNSLSDDIRLIQEHYGEQAALIEEKLSFIVAGQELSGEELLKISQDVINNLKNHNNILKYMIDLNAAYNGIYTHSLNVALICHLFATWLILPEDNAKELVAAGLLHDIGKMISDGEYEKHPAMGAQFLTERGISKDIQLGVLMHHEKEDGSGFPTKAKWDKIHHYAKIISIADYYDNATTGGKKLQGKICPFELIEMFENRRYGSFDIKYMDIFLNKIANYYVGESVRLTDGRTGKIIFINKHCLSKPIIQIGEELLDTYYHRDLQIVEII